MPKKPLPKKIKILLYSLTALIILLLVLRNCGLSGGPITGNVIDDSTGKPIAEAIVVAHWSGTAFALVESQTTCVRVESTTTNKKGTFFISPWLQWPGTFISDPVVYFSAYKKGYQRVKDKFDGNTVYLEPFTGTRGARLEYLKQMIRSTGCHGAGKSERNLFNFGKAIYEEAKVLSITEDDKKMLQWLREVVAGKTIVEDGNTTQREYDRKIDEFLKDHLQ